MAPRSRRKLANTLMAQFKVVDPFALIATLAEQGIVVMDNDRVIWS